MAAGRASRGQYQIIWAVMDKEAAVSVKNLRFAYAKRNNQVLHGLDLEVRKGQIVALLGGSGSGKSTVLSLITGQNRVQDNGSQVSVLGYDMLGISNRRLYQMRRRIGMMFQVSSLFTGMSVFDNVAFPLREHSSLSEEQINDLVMLKLHAVGPCATPGAASPPSCPAASAGGSSWPGRWRWTRT